MSVRVRRVLDHGAESLMKSDVRLAPSRSLLVLAVGISALLHFGVVWFVSVTFRAPDLGIEFQVPIDVELGLSEEVAMAGAPVSPPAPSPAPIVPDQALADDGKADSRDDKKKKKKHDPVPDAGTPDAESDAGTPSDDDADAGTGLVGDTQGSRLPPGAQIAVRVDMSRIRNSPVAADVRALIAAIPDWQALLDGSGIDPVEQLDRLLIATPNLQRAKIVLAGRFMGEPRVVEDAVTRLASARGVIAPWKKRAGVRVAPWANPDATPRVVALVGPSHFTISRAEDLPRVLAIAAARAGKTPKDDEKDGVKHPADALLSMEEGEGLSLEVDGVEQFIRRATRGIPQKLRLSAVEIPGPKLELRGRLEFADEDSAADAVRFWSAMRDAYARNALVKLLGLSDPLRESTIEQDVLELRGRLVLSVEQTRLILGYARELLTPPRSAPSSPSRNGDVQGAPTLPSSSAAPTRAP